MNIKPRLYADANIKKGPQYFDYDNFEITFGYHLCFTIRTLENYEVVRKLGRGKYAEVFEGIDVRTLKKVVIKVLKPIRKKKIKREVKIL